jgi:rhodanese-related sulfurtransferase
MRWLLPVGLAAILLTGVTAAPADDPEVPERYIKVDAVKARLDQKKPVVFIDVRPKEQYDATHIRGALSIPLRELPHRLAEVPRTDVLVLY